MVSTASKRANPSTPSIGNKEGDTDVLSDTRWHTKVFALDCLCQLLSVPSFIHPADTDLRAARSLASPQYALVTHVLDFITVACMATGAQFDEVRVSGTRLMKCVVEGFGNVKDPEGTDQGELLLVST